MGCQKLANNPRAFANAMEKQGRTVLEFSNSDEDDWRRVSVDDGEFRRRPLNTTENPNDTSNVEPQLGDDCTEGYNRISNLTPFGKRCLLFSSESDEEIRQDSSLPVLEEQQGLTQRECETSQCQVDVHSSAKDAVGNAACNAVPCGTQREWGNGRALPTQRDRQQIPSRTPGGQKRKQWQKPAKGKKQWKFAAKNKSRKKNVPGDVGQWDRLAGKATSMGDDMELDEIEDARVDQQGPPLTMQLTQQQHTGNLTQIGDPATQASAPPSTLNNNNNNTMTPLQSSQAVGMGNNGISQGLTGCRAFWASLKVGKKPRGVVGKKRKQGSGRWDTRQRLKNLIAEDKQQKEVVEMLTVDEQGELHQLDLHALQFECEGHLSKVLCKVLASSCPMPGQVIAAIRSKSTRVDFSPGRKFRVFEPWLQVDMADNAVPILLCQHLTQL